MTASIFIRAFILCTVVTVCTCYPYLQESLPNGKNVPHPCISGAIWEGVGHENRNGAGTRNAFGLDFKKNNLVWNAEICNKDSDGDGKTNGEELGDPDCIWSPGLVPKYTSGLSHPGVCEPLDSPICGGKPSFVDCEDTGKFECDAINEADTFNYTVRFPETAIQAKETTYICITFEFPMDQEYHLVAYDPYIDNRDVMHHTLVFGCEGVDAAPGPLMQPTECGGTMDGCREIIAVWAAGGGGDCMNRNMGFLIGANKGLKYAIMQHHWNNPREISDFKDSSGMTFYLTPNLRPYNAGFLMIGQLSLDIPPKRGYHAASGSCSSSCLSQYLDGSIYVTQVVNHMHLLGASQFTELRRNNSFAMHLAQDRVYDYNTPVYHTYRDPVMIHDGDELKTTCIFNSEIRTRTTSFGDATSDEMCLAFFTYYPKENLRTGTCIGWKSLSQCEMRHQEVIRGCNTRQMFDFSDPETLRLIAPVQELCVPGKCLQECLEYVRELKKHPCFSGDVGKYLRYYSTVRGQSSMESIVWYARLDSCDVELLKEQYGDINASSKTTPFHVKALLLITLFFYFQIK